MTVPDRVGAGDNNEGDSRARRHAVALAVPAGVSLVGGACALLILLSASFAKAQPTPPSADGGATCEPIVRQLEASRHDTARAREAASAAEHRVSECNAEVAATSTRLQESTAATKACEQKTAQICSATAAFADEVARGRASGAAETTCISPEQQARLDAAVGGWSGTAAWLGQLASYQSGETDVLPRPRGGASPIERAAQKVARNGGERAFHRRLLVEALELIAPRAWTRIHTAGPGAAEAWLASKSPLDPDVIAEAQNGHKGGSGPAGPPLTAALHLVRAFEVAAKCAASDPDGRECVRARQLQQVLESTGSLVMRRRVQEIWATECAGLDAEAVRAWTEDFPTAPGAGESSWREIAENAHAKLFACYLDDASEHVPFGPWLKEHLPSAATLTASRLQHVDAIRHQWVEGSRESKCARAVRAMQTIAVPNSCSVPAGDFREALTEWTNASEKLDDAGMPLAMCAQFAQLLWEGKAASIDGAFAHPPSIDEMVVAKPMPPTPMWRLRSHCEDRRGPVSSFARDVDFLSSLAGRFGEGVDHSPFRVDPATRKPFELLRFEESQGNDAWLSHLTRGVSACSRLGLADERCNTCKTLPAAAAYDCALVERLDATWTLRSRAAAGAIAALALLIAAATWLRRLSRARAAYASWANDAVSFFEGIGLSCRRDRWRFLAPSRHDTLYVSLPSDPAWERWGTLAAVVRVPPGTRVLERDVNHGAFVGRRAGASVVLLEHNDTASPDLSAVRAMLEWAAKGGSRAVQVLPIGVSRSRWSKSAHDVLDLVEESSLRGNPFEIRGRIATSTQFFNRERLVSGLLASAQTGHWTVVTGLRRFGKSSLVLEVARRLPGPSAYVDVAGFDHEIAHGSDPSVAADAILRFVCLRLVESARERWSDEGVAWPAVHEGSIDAAALTQWIRDYSRACNKITGRTAPVLVVLDEIEQALAVGPTRLAHALDVLAIVLGRLKSAVGDAATPGGGSPIGVFLTSALHPLLWAPLRTLAHQSIMGSFQRVCVPCLGEDAAATMMRSLGGRQGIRFSDEALARLVTESQGVPLLLRRLGASILELYDAERARQGSLGAVEVGIEGTSEALDREVREGSPLRVWIETEIAGRDTVPGVLLRTLAHHDSVAVSELNALATARVAEDFVYTGIAATLPPDELERRSEEAAHVIVQLIEESGLVAPLGDLTAPHSYSLPEGTVRRVLRARALANAAPSNSSES